MKTSFAAAFAATAMIIAATGASATPTFAVWLDGNTDPSGGSNGILGALTTDFGAGSYQLVSTSDLESAGFLTPFKTIIVSRYGANFGTSLSALAAANVSAYVGLAGSAGQGGVATFTNDAADNLNAVGGNDPYDANLAALFKNAASFASMSGHGYVGEFNGAAMAETTNANGVALGLLLGNAGALGGFGPQFTYDVGPIGAGNPIDAGVTFPFTDSDSSTFLTAVTGFDLNNVDDIYSNDEINGHARCSCEQDRPQLKMASVPENRELVSDAGRLCRHRRRSPRPQGSRRSSGSLNFTAAPERPLGRPVQPFSNEAGSRIPAGRLFVV